jgi:hypothetical protein
MKISFLPKLANRFNRSVAPNRRQKETAQSRRGEDRCRKVPLAAVAGGVRGDAARVIGGAMSNPFVSSGPSGTTIIPDLVPRDTHSVFSQYGVRVLNCSRRILATQTKSLCLRR